MATHKSAAKRARQSLRKEDFNSQMRGAVKTLEKKLRKMILQKDVKNAQEFLKEFMSKIDKASKRSVFHPRAASRKIGRLSAQVSALGK